MGAAEKRLRLETPVRFGLKKCDETKARYEPAVTYLKKMNVGNFLERKARGAFPQPLRTTFPILQPLGYLQNGQILRQPTPKFNNLEIRYYPRRKSCCLLFYYYYSSSL